MNNESLELSSPGTNTGTTNASKFIDSTSYIYNRNTHDKTVCVSVAEIQCMISVGTICGSDNIENLQQLMSNYGSLFDTDFVNEIQELSKEDLIRICNYHYNEDRFSGTEFMVLMNLVNFHIEEFRKDIRNGNLNDIVKLSVSMDTNTGEYNLIVKLYPSKSTAVEPVLYVRSLLYLVLFHLYKHLNRHAYNYLIECSHHTPMERFVVWVIKSVFTYIVPIMSIVKYKVTTSADDNYTWFVQLKQLESSYKFLARGGGENQVVYTFRPKEQYLTSTLNDSVVNEVPSETNYTARFVECSFTFNKNKTLTCEITIVGKDMVDSVFSTQMDEENDTTPMFSRLSDAEDVYLSYYSILHRILSYTEQHEQEKARLRLESEEDVRTNRFTIISDISDSDKVQVLTKSRTLQHAFDKVEVPTPDDQLFSFVKHELEKMGQKNGLFDYIAIILEYFKEDNDVIDDALAPLDKRVANKIWKVIKKLRKQKFAPIYSLNTFYREYC